MLLFGNSKPTSCAVLCNAGVGPCETPFSLPARFSYFRLQGRQRKTGKQEVEPGDCLLLTCLTYLPWQTTPISSTWSQHSASSGTPTTTSLGLGDPCFRWECLRIQSQSPGFLQLLMAPLLRFYVLISALLPLVYSSPRTETPSCGYYIHVTFILSFLLI